MIKSKPTTIAVNSYKLVKLLINYAKFLIFNTPNVDKQDQFYKYISDIEPCEDFVDLPHMSYISIYKGSLNIDCDHE